MEITQFVTLVSVAFICAWIDKSLGMGYGTILTPLLLTMGFLPLQVVPCVLFSEVLTGILAGLFHHRFGNIKLDFRRDEELLKKRLRGLGYIPKSRDSKVVLILALCGIVGAIVSVAVALNIPKFALNTYIGVMVLAIGIVILWQRNLEFRFTWNKVVGLGLLSSFNKGISGGGYGPLVTGGLMLSGEDSKSAIGSTSFAEGLVCLTAFLLYIIAKRNIYWKLAIPLTIGAVASAPFGALTTKKTEVKRLKLIVGIFTVVLGAYTLAKVYIL